MNGGRRRPAAFTAIATALALLLAGGFLALGLWQVQRLGWKRDLTARIDARIHAAPVPAPRDATAADAYRRVRADGRFLHDKAVLVQASTVRGAGYWVLTPLVTSRGFTLIVNRGFVPPEAKTRHARPQGTVTITGLLRTSEPGGGFLRDNDPAANRWYSRDVAAIAARQALPGPVAPYFVDAAAQGDGYPAGGLTVVRFPNNHLGYAITWFALAALTLAAYGVVMVQDRKPPHP